MTDAMAEAGNDDDTPPPGGAPKPNPLDHDAWVKGRGDVTTPPLSPPLRPNPVNALDYEAWAKSLRPVSKAPPPIKPLSGGSVRVEPKPVIPPPLPNCVAFQNIPETLAAFADAWGVPAEHRPARKTDIEAHARQIANRLAVTPKQEFGLDGKDGSLWWAVAQTWRMLYRVAGNEVDAVTAAMHGNPVRFHGRPDDLPCRTFLTCRALALAFGATNPPEAPPQSAMDEVWDTDRPTARPAPASPVAADPEARAEAAAPSQTPAATSSASIPPAATQETTAKKPHAGGAPRRKDRDTFIQEVNHRLAIDGGNRTLAQFRADMKQWAATGMNPAPDDRTVERWIEQIVRPGTLPE